MREVIFINENDRPKAVDPLSFTEWLKDRFSEDQLESVPLLNQHLDRDHNNYLEYLITFKADDKPVEFTHNQGGDTGWKPVTKNSCIQPPECDKVYLHGFDSEGLGVFTAHFCNTIASFKGHLNSGKY